MKKQTTIKELAHDYFRRGQLGLVSPDSESAYTEAMKFSQEFVRFSTELPEIKEKPYYIICHGVLNKKKILWDFFSCSWICDKRKSIWSNETVWLYALASSFL